MFSLSRILLLSFATASLVSATSNTDVLNDLKAADVTVQDLGTQCNAYTGTGSAFAALASSVSKHQTQIQRAVNDINAINPAFTAAGYQQVLSFLCGQSLTNVKNFLACLKNRKAVFINSGVKVNLCQQLNKLRASFQALFNALIPVAPTSALAQQAVTCRNQFDAIFADILAFYGC